MSGSTRSRAPGKVTPHRSRVASRQRLVLHLFVLSLAVVAMLWIKTLVRSQQAFEQGERAMRASRYDEAIDAYGRAIKWYTPMSSAARLAVSRLWDIGLDAEQRHDPPRALAAYRALRSSLYAAQSLYVPHRQWIAESEKKIAALMAMHEGSAPVARAPGGTAQARYLSMLRRHKSPHIGWSVVVVFGFIGWVGLTVSWLWRAMTRQITWAWRQALWWGGSVAVCFAVWIVGMLLA